VPAEYRCTFDLVTNIGTTEHVTDQINAFRVIHEFAKPGANFLHSVPFAGYFNHGLYNYHPIFFVFLASANEYEIVHLGLSDPGTTYATLGCAELTKGSSGKFRNTPSGTALLNGDAPLSIMGPGAASR
jgi:hypothetical protein